ncbi:hypothetical protein MJO28_001354 [Puccinia striiformis f. sp. tritici]|uniref:Uncharacterized protein n=1 Tax=Puccinia striiformis f. sp. tritici TaxID=168172 RepID=A0ACC0EVI8_9BASI|nr:hypothetical protein Pst134EA_003386 [Puccinia striiformis f. sp. tritici]KAH9472782.1 hypothetical protein Pst134EA_003386 [Puccinia striiformis f. sp. tritici]KAI7960865.1 hypothetical protein MJO28_001354 [Puccinia striiformis f. sp. tritici]KAI7965617.1 hypothetical protein MJO29_001365 [Puccinia striiformis f. sp. tritici]
MPESIELHRKQQHQEHQQHQDSSLLEERLRIAEFVLPEDNLEDLLQLPIAPELISKKYKQQQAVLKQQRREKQEQEEQLAAEEQEEEEQKEQERYQEEEQRHQDEERYQEQERYQEEVLQAPRIQQQQQPKPTASSHRLVPSNNRLAPSTPKSQRSVSAQTAAQRQRERSKSTANQLSPTIITKPATPRTTPSKPSSRSTTNTKKLKLRPRSLSASSIRDSIGPGSLPPWTTDPSPRIYRVDQSNNSPLHGDDFKPPSHDDLILPTVARQIEKNSKLLFAASSHDLPQSTITPIQNNDTFSTIHSNFSQWETLGPQLLLRKASRKLVQNSTFAGQDPATTIHADLNESTNHDGLEIETETISGGGYKRKSVTEEESEQKELMKKTSLSTSQRSTEESRRRTSTYLSPTIPSPAPPTSVTSGRRGSSSHSSSGNTHNTGVRRMLNNNTHLPLSSDDEFETSEIPTQLPPLDSDNTFPPPTSILPPAPHLLLADKIDPSSPHLHQHLELEQDQEQEKDDGCCKCIIV